MDGAMESFLRGLIIELSSVGTDVIDITINNKKTSLKSIKPDKIRSITLITPKKINPLLIFKFNDDITDEEKALFHKTLQDSKLVFLKHKSLDLYVIPLSLSGFKNAADDELMNLCGFLANRKEAFTYQFLVSRLTSLSLSDEEYHKIKYIINNKISSYNRLSISIRNSIVHIPDEYKDSEVPFFDQVIPDDINIDIDEGYALKAEENSKYLVVTDEKTGETIKFDLGDIVFKKRVLGFDKSFLLVEAKGKEAAIPLEYCASKQKFITSLLVQVGDPCLEHIPQKYWVKLLRKIVDETPEDNNNFEILYKTFKTYLYMQFQVSNSTNGSDNLQVVSKMRTSFYKDGDQFIYVPFESIYELLKKESNESQIVFRTRLNSAGIEIDKENSLIKIPIMMPEFQNLFKEAIQEFEASNTFGEEVSKNATGNSQIVEEENTEDKVNESNKTKDSNENEDKAKEQLQDFEFDPFDYEVYSV